MQAIDELRPFASRAFTAEATASCEDFVLPHPTVVPVGPRRKEDARAWSVPRLVDLHSWLWFERKQSILLVIQGMDASGKDGAIRHLCSQLNPEAFRVYGFRTPSPEEARRHFLDRVRAASPVPGMISFLNRSHYEEVLVPKVREVVDERQMQGRYAEINEFEASLMANRTRVVKILLHISPQEQLRRLLARLDEPRKRWKLSQSDLAERRHWHAYQEAYRQAIWHCSASASWHIVPADKKWYRDWAVTRILADTLIDMNPRRPGRRMNVARARRRLLETAFMPMAGV